MAIPKMRAYLVDSKNAIQSLFAAVSLHIRVDGILKVQRDTIDVHFSFRELG